MNGSGQNGHAPVGADELPGPGLWILFLDGGVLHLARTTTELSESEVASEIELKGFSYLSLRPVIVLDGLRGATGDMNRSPSMFTIAYAQRLDQRTGFVEDFTLHIAVRSAIFISTLSRETRAKVRAKIEQVEDSLARARAEKVGISLPTMRDQ